MKHIDTIIIGAGISGISLAQRFTNQNIDNFIIDPNDIGGCISSQKYEDFWFEMGAHTIYNSYSNTINFIQNNSLDDEIITRKKAPFLLVQPNNKIQSIFTNINPFSLIASFIKYRKLPKKGKTVSEYAEKVFGKSNYDKTLKYCFNAVLSQDSSSFPMEYLFKKYKRDTTLPRSFTFNGGLSKLFKKHKQTIIKETVLEIHKENSKWLIETDKCRYSCNYLCLATPWNITAKLLKQVNCDIENHPFAPKMSNLISIGIVLNKKDTNHIKNLAGLIGKKQFFYSAVTRDVVSHPKLRAFAFHCHKKASEKELIKKISELLNISHNDILFSYIKNNVLPCYHINHSVFIEDLDKSLEDVSNLFITGNFFDRLAIENCIRRSNKEFERFLETQKEKNK